MKAAKKATPQQSQIETAILKQEEELRLIRRQAGRGERYVIGRLKRLEKDHRSLKRRLARLRYLL
jgi:hypothetical protein